MYKAVTFKAIFFSPIIRLPFFYLYSLILCLYFLPYLLFLYSSPKVIFSLLFLYCLSTKLFVLEMIDITKDKKTNKKDTLTLGGILLASVIQMPYIIVMPYLKTLKTLFFKGTNITDFFNWYKLIYTDF